VTDPITASWDTTNTFSVEVPWGTLESRTADEVLAGFNTCVVQRSDGTVELLGFQTATLTAPKTYTLSNLLRRIRQNSSFSGGSAGDKFAMLTQSTTKLIGMQLQDAGAEFEFAGPRYGTAIADAATQLITLTGMSKKPLSPIEVTGTRDGLGNLTIEWTRRTRIGGTWATGENGPVSEATEAYEVDILSAASPPTVLRTLTSSTPTVTYAIADQISDFGSPAPGAVDVEVYQMSAFIGRGYPAAATV
jgi:ribulose bisphosphate carboxylase small subunit